MNHLILRHDDFDLLIVPTEEGFLVSAHGTFDTDGEVVQIGHIRRSQTEETIQVFQDEGVEQ